MADSWINQIVLKAATDADFKAALISQPKQTVNQFLSDAGLPRLAKDVNVSVILEVENSLTIIVPANTEELTEADLAAIAGGAPRGGRYEGPGNT